MLKSSPLRFPSLDPKSTISPRSVLRSRSVQDAVSAFWRCALPLRLCVRGWGPPVLLSVLCCCWVLAPWPSCPCLQEMEICLSPNHSLAPKLWTSTEVSWLKLLPAVTFPALARAGKKEQIQARAMSDWKWMRNCNWAVLRLLRCCHNCMLLNPWGGVMTPLRAKCTGAWGVQVSYRCGMEVPVWGKKWNQGLGSLTALCRVRRSWEGRSGWRAAAEAHKGWSMQPPSIESLCLCHHLSADQDVWVWPSAPGQWWGEFSGAPQEIYTDKLLFWDSFTTFPSCRSVLQFEAELLGAQEAFRLSNHPLNKHLCAECHMRCDCHQSIRATGKGVPAYPWEPWEKGSGLKVVWKKWCFVWKHSYELYEIMQFHMRITPPSSSAVLCWY